MKIPTLSLLTLVIVPCIIFSTHVFSQDEGVVSEPSLNERLVSIVSTIESKEKQVAEEKKKLKGLEDEVLISQSEQKIATDEDIIRGLRSQFINLSAGGEKIYVERKVVDKKINWQEDLEAIFSPLIQQLKEISERPKIIEELEQEITFWSKRSEQLNRAINFIQTSLNVVSDKQVKKQLNTLLDEAQSQYVSAQQKLSLSEDQLKTIEKNENPFWNNIIDLIKSFAASMLYYLTIAILLGFVTYQCVALIARIPKSFIDKKQPKRYVFAARTINLIKTAVGFSLAAIVYMTVLYSSGQWILLVISAFILIGGMLTLRNLIPKYFVEIRTLLNLGSIRQGERVVYQGLVWRVNLIDVYTHLHNPALDAHLRVPIGNLIDSSSRPFHKNEAWFPTSVGDVVLLDDGAFGVVKLQSADVVELDFGSSVYTYQTASFLQNRPRNLSQGFTVYEVFGFDYQHQNISTTQMLATYKGYINKALETHAVGEYLTFFTVEFDKAAASSLDFKVIAGFSGEAARDFFRIKRIIQSASVDAANQYGWTIPFQQLTIHHTSTD